MKEIWSNNSIKKIYLTLFILVFNIFQIKASCLQNTSLNIDSQIVIVQFNDVLHSGHDEPDYTLLEVDDLYKKSFSDSVEMSKSNIYSEMDNDKTYSTIIADHGQIIQKQDSLYKELEKIKTKKWKGNINDSMSKSIIPSFSHLKDKIASNQAFIEYFIKDSIYIFVLTEKDYKVITAAKGNFLSSLKEFSTELEKRCNLKNSTILYDKMLNKRLQAISMKLYNEIFQPVVDSGTLKNVDELLIAPDYSIYSLPFEMLLQPRQSDTSNDEAYLGDIFTIHYFQNTEFFGERKRLSDFFDRTDKMLAITKSNFNEYPRLSNLNPINISELRKSFNNIDLVVEEHATKEKILEKELFDYKYLYISTHLVLNEIPELSYLALTDSQLSLSNTFTLNLNSKVTVLSTCQAANGTFQRGGEIMGFTRGLMYAGTESVVISLWPVEDRASEYLFNRFWVNIANGDLPKVALLKAKKYLRTLDKKYDNPFYWASFVLFGQD